jgi:hypothetical protein
VTASSSNPVGRQEYIQRKQQIEGENDSVASPKTEVVVRCDRWDKTGFLPLVKRCAQGVLKTGKGGRKHATRFRHGEPTFNPREAFTRIVCRQPARSPDLRANTDVVELLSAYAHKGLELSRPSDSAFVAS